jgi:hypothetical protein
LITKALANQPKEVVEEARRRIEAGEKVTIEELTQDVTEGAAEEPKS